MLIIKFRKRTFISLMNEPRGVACFLSYLTSKQIVIIAQVCSNY